ncbi:uncharacterized protein [Watersipora subatra]|uniref:uncharacterized protein n=1 Tax=Watersipora subatra TaxID=2589382 RepID=UPI00355BFCE0
MPRVVTLAPPQRNSQALLCKVSQAPGVSSESAGTSAGAEDVLEQLLSNRPRTKISLKGRPMIVNGELGVFIPNSLLDQQDVDFTIQPEALLPDSSTHKWKRTIGISTSHDVPTEIGPIHQNEPQLIGWDRLGAARTIMLPSSGKVVYKEHDTQTTEEDFYDFNAFREKYLPKSEKYSYNYTGREGSDLVIFRMTGLTCKESMRSWLEALEFICNVHYRVWKTYKGTKEGVYKVDLRCHMNQGTNRKTMKGKDFGCRSMLAIKVDPPKISKGAAFKAIRERFRCRVRFRYVHNHTAKESLRNMSVRKDIQIKILNFFEQGMSISDAYLRHYQDLKSEYGEKYNEMLCNRSLCPDKGYFYSVWKTFCMAHYGKVLKPPKSRIPKVPWNKGLKGITSLKQFLPMEDPGKKGCKGELSKKERIRQAALAGIESSLMESIRQNPETYSRAVSSFAEMWSSMDDRDRLSWLQTRTVDSISQKIVLFSPEQLDETMEAAENINLIDFTQPSYSDVVIGGEQRYDCDSRKHLKFDDHPSADGISDFTLCNFSD